MRQLRPVAQAGSVREKLVQSDLTPSLRAILEPAAEGIVDREDTFVGEEEEGCGGELLRDGGELEPSLDLANGVRLAACGALCHCQNIFGPGLDESDPA